MGPTDVRIFTKIVNVVGIDRNKARYMATLVARMLAGAVMDMVSGEFEQEQCIQSTQKRQKSKMGTN